MKTCRKCGDVKPADDKHFPVRAATGKLRPTCRRCISADSMERYYAKQGKARPETGAAPKPLKPSPRKDCRRTGRCNCETHLPAGYWLQLERNARKFADEMERLEETNPAEARRREAELLGRPSSKTILR